MIAKLRASFQAFQKDLFWLPAAFWALFLLLILTLFKPEEQVNAAQAFLVYLLPLLTGGLAAYAFLEDPALELHFASPQAAGRMLASRLGLVAAVAALTALSFQAVLVLAGIAPGLGSFVQAQLAWAVPALALMTVGVFTSLLGRSSAAGGSLVGALWIFQIMARGWFFNHDVWRYFFLFFGGVAPGHPEAAWNQLALTALALAALYGSWRLLQRQERYI